jgi:hypothetical protein
MRQQEFIDFDPASEVERLQPDGEEFRGPVIGRVGRLANGHALFKQKIAVG